MQKRMSIFRTTIALSFILPIGFSHAEEEAYIARAVSVSGKVLLRGEGSTTAQMAFLKPGDRLYKGAIVNTGSDGTVKLLMTDRTIIDLGPSSLFKMNDYQLGKVGDRKVDLSLDYGQVRASVNEKLTSNKGKFTIRTKTATMGVRGTEFVVNVPVASLENKSAPETTSLTVMHGKVEVVDSLKPSAPPIAVTPGFQFRKSGDSLGKVSELGMKAVGEVKAAAFQKDMTFMQTVSFDQSSSTSSESKNSAKDSEAKTVSSAGAGKQTMENIAMTVETQAKDTEKPQITDLKLPGTFTPDIPQVRPIDQLNGRVVNLRVRICTNGNPGC